MKVLKGSQLVTIQDLGRKGFRAFGVPLSGVMDENAAGWANAILGNEPNAAVIEVAMPGFSLKSHEKTAIVVSGKEGDWKLNDSKISPFKLLVVNPSDVISCTKISDGNYLYLAVKGGFKTPITLNSRSMYPNITEYAYCETSLELSCDSFDVLTNPYSAVRRMDENSSSSTRIEVRRGPEFHLLNESWGVGISELEIAVSSQISRMGFLMEHGSILLDKEYSMLSSAVMPGTVQLLPSGKCIVLMKDAQTTGGYPRILQVKKDSLSTLAQCKPGRQVRFDLKTM